MARYNASVFDDIRDILYYCRNNADHKLPEVNIDDLEKFINTVDEKNKFIKVESQKIKEAQKERDENFSKANDLTYRIKRLIQGIFGPDSKEVKEIGLIPKSEKKNPKRKIVKKE